VREGNGVLSGAGVMRGKPGFSEDFRRSSVGLRCELTYSVATGLAAGCGEAASRLFHLSTLPFADVAKP
jgi:hypothetical protein